MPKSTTNSKAEAGRARKAEQEAKKKEKEAAALEAEISKEWQKGSNQRGAARAESAAAKADEAARKRAEKAALLAAEEEAMGGGKGAKKVPTLSRGKGKKKKSNDLSLLEDALVGEAEKKNKAKKKAEQLKKEKEEAAAKAKAEKEATQTLDPLMQNTEAMLGAGSVGREANKATMELDGVSGIDGALHTLAVGTGGDIKRQKALYMAFEDRMLPVVKEDHPGLRLTQYKEKVFQLWKKSPENPQNQLDKK